jgi:hypothetical protein
MKRESELFFEAMLKEDRPVTDLLGTDFTFLNERLAKHYGIPGVKGDQLQRVTLPKDSPRGSVLTQGAVLMVTSTPTRTAPVIRGKWVLEQILGISPPPPPPDVPPLPEQHQASQSASCGKGWSNIARRLIARVATRRWIRSGLLWRTSMRSEHGGIRTENSPSTLRARCPAAAAA